MPATETERVLTALFEAATPVLQREFRPDCCILGTRIAIEALDAFGVRARPQGVGLLVFNAEAYRLLNEEGATQEELAAIMAPIGLEEPGGPWVIGVDPSLEGRNPKRYNGHLVAIVEGGILVDLTLPQVDRPQKGIKVEPLAMELGEPWEHDGFAYAEFDGTVVVYRRNDETKWQLAPDWTWPAGVRRQTYRQVTGEIIRAMRKELG